MPGVVKRKNEYNWKPADKARAVAAYSATGSYTKAAEITGVPENTIRYWGKQDWFAEELRRVDKADTDEIKSTFTRIVKKASSELEDRLERGDEVVTKDGTVVLKKIGGKDLAIIAAVATDKRKQAMDQPSTVAVQSSQEKLLSLMEQFIKFSKAKETAIDAEIIIENDPESRQGDSDAGEATSPSTEA